MINPKTIEECLGRLSALRFFPSNAYALVAIAEILQEICPDDGEAKLLVYEVLKDSDEWPGPESLRKTYSRIVNHRARAERDRVFRGAYAEARREKETHEATCDGYSIEIDDEKHTVSVTKCQKVFERPGLEMWQAPQCRKGDSISEMDCERRLTEELTRHPGYCEWTWGSVTK